MRNTAVGARHSDARARAGGVESDTDAEAVAASEPPGTSGVADASTVAGASGVFGTSAVSVASAVSGTSGTSGTTRVRASEGKSKPVRSDDHPDDDLAGGEDRPDEQRAPPRVIAVEEEGAQGTQRPGELQYRGIDCHERDDVPPAVILDPRGQQHVGERDAGQTTQAVSAMNSQNSPTHGRAARPMSVSTMPHVSILLSPKRNEARGTGRAP